MIRLDDTVCRGSLIFHKGKRFVVLGRLSTIVLQGSRYGVQTWKIVEVQHDVAEIRVGSVTAIARDAEVDAFFPGCVYELPDYLT